MGCCCAPLEEAEQRHAQRDIGLPIGEYRFKYCTEAGEWFCDPQVNDLELNEFNTENSVLIIRQR